MFLNLSKSLLKRYCLIMRGFHLTLEKRGPLQPVSECTQISITGLSKVAYGVDVASTALGDCRTKSDRSHPVIMLAAPFGARADRSRPAWTVFPVNASQRVHVVWHVNALRQSSPPLPCMQSLQQAMPGSFWGALFCVPGSYPSCSFLDNTPFSPCNAKGWIREGSGQGRAASARAPRSPQQAQKP